MEDFELNDAISSSYWGVQFRLGANQLCHVCQQVLLKPHHDDAEGPARLKVDRRGGFVLTPVIFVAMMLYFGFCLILVHVTSSPTDNNSVISCFACGSLLVIIENLKLAGCRREFCA